MKKFSLLATCLLAITFLAGCGGGRPSEESHSHSHDHSSESSEHSHSHEESSEHSHDHSSEHSHDHSSEHSHSSEESHSHDHSHDDSSQSDVHVHSLRHVAAVEATCDADGNIEYDICSSCGRLFNAEGVEISASDVKLNKLGHAYGEWVYETLPTCTEKGTQKRVCSRDATHFETREVEKLEHQLVFSKFEWESDGSAAKAVYKCSNEGCQHEVKYAATVNETKHVVADCENEEQYTYVASYDGNQESKIFAGEAKLNHEYKFNSFIWGEGYETCEVLLVCANNDAHTQTVAVTKLETKVTQERSCFKDETTSFTATYGDHTETKTLVTAAQYGEHSPAAAVKENNVDPTCSAEGSYDEVVYCSRCGEELSRTHEEVEKLEHTAKEAAKENVVAATCTTDGGYDLVVRCEDCNAIISSNHVVEKATGHTQAAAVKENVVDPTCTEKGSYDEVVKCATCGAVISSEHKSSDATDHDWGEWTVVTKPTCTDPGEEQRVCKHDEKHVENREVAALGHKKGEPVKENVVAATFDKAGSYEEVVYCQTCKEELSRTPKVEPKLEHHYGEWKTIKEATCEAKGEKRAYCTDEGFEEEYLSEVIPALGHDYKDNVVNPTCTEKGYTTHSCSRCESSYVDSYKDPLGHKWDNDDPICESSRECTVTVCHTIEEKVEHNYVLDDSKTTQATCEENGYHYSYCSYCGKESKELYAPKTGHDYKLVKTADKDNPCLIHQTMVCDHDSNHSYAIDDIYEHSYITEIVTDPTCSADGLAYKRCSVCGEYELDELDNKKEYVLPADATNGHEWVLGTPDGDGKRVDTCKHCSKTRTVYEYTSGSAIKGSKLSENGFAVNNTIIKIDNDTATGILDKGTTNVTLSVDATDKSSLTDKLSEDDLAKISDSATVYDFTLTDKDTEDNISNFDGYITITIPYILGANEDPDGIIIYYINDNGELEEIEGAVYNNGFVTFKTNHFSNYVVGKLSPAEICNMKGHDWVEAIIPGSCTQDEVKVTTCSRCGAEVREVLTEAKGHNYVLDETNSKAPTCTESGYDRYTCSECSATYDLFVAAKGHNYVLDEANSKAPTCTQGVYELYRCSECSKTKTINVPMLGHSFVVDKVVDRTCEEDGYTVYKCEHEGCAVSYKANYKSALGHEWGEWEITEAPTCSSYGKATQTCTHGCGEVNEKILPMTKHTPGEVQIVVGKAATCTSTGYHYEEVRCTECNILISKTRVEDGKVDHTYGEWVVVEPTCTVNGSKTRTCSVCGHSETEIIYATGHVAAEEAKENEIKATCDKAGGYDLVIRCSECGQILSSKHVDVPALGHDWDDGKVTIEATCNGEGQIIYTCKNDPSHTRVEIIPATNKHNYKEFKEDEVAPTCTKDGSYKLVVKCEDCGKVYSTEFITVKATGHTYGEWVVETEPTCTIPGYRTRKCSVCGFEEYEEIAPLGHSPKDAVREDEVEPTCTTDGHYDEVVYCDICGKVISRTTTVLPAFGHEWGDWKVIDDGSCTTDHVEQRTCVHDKNHVETRTVKATGHTPAQAVKENEVAPTCTEKGGYDQVIYCSTCGEELSRKHVDVDALGHTPAKAVKENQVAATCTTDGGYDQVVYCSVCNAELSRTHKVIPATGHTEGMVQRENVKDETCTEKGGYDEVVYCTVCEAEISRKHVEIDPTGHTPGKAVKENEVAPTCTEKGGYDKVVYCTECGEELSRAHKEIDALGHKWGEWKVVKEGTCTEATIEECVCENDPSHKQTRTIEAGGHIAGEVVIENKVAPTCTEKGGYDEVVYCTVCEAEISRKHVEIDPTGHTPGKAVKENEVAPTCTEKGGYDEVVYCTECGEELSRAHKEIDALDHKWGEWKVVKEGTCTEATIEECVCENDPSHKQTRTIEAGGHIAGEVVIENKVAPTCNNKGGYDEVVYCTECGEELSRKYVEIAALGHTTLEAVKENEVKATCDKAGSYDEVVYCSVCKEELSRKKVTVPATGHTAGMVQRENVVSETCTEKGGYDEVTYCTVCEAEISRKHVDIPATGHDWGEWVTDKLPTCTEKGSAYRICKNDESHKETKELDALGHKAGSVVKENVIPATCTEPGSYDEVIYCTVCKAEMSRETIVVPAVGHKVGDWVSNATEHYHVCSVCAEILDKGEHVYEGNVCTVCGYKEADPSACDHDNLPIIQINLADLGYCEDNPSWDAKYCPVCDRYILEYTETLAQPKCNFNYTAAEYEKIVYEGKELVFGVVTCSECGKKMYQYVNQTTDGCTSIMDIVMGFEGTDGELVYVIATSVYKNHPYNQQIQVNREDIGCKGNVITYTACGVCGEIVNIDMGGMMLSGCEANFELIQYDYDYKTGLGVIHGKCKECGLEVYMSFAQENLDECIAKKTGYFHIFDAENEYLEYTKFEYTYNHEYETTYEFINGKDCSEGVIKTYRCKNCGDYSTSKYEGHVTTPEIIDLNEYGAPGQIFVNHCEACGQDLLDKVYPYFETTHNETKTVDEDGHFHFAVVETNETYQYVFESNRVEYKEGCKIISEVNSKVSIKGTVIFESTNRSAREDHTIDPSSVSYRFIGENCEQGIIATATCSVCGATVEDRYYGHPSYHHVSIDLAEAYGLCGGTYEGEQCDLCNKITNGNININDESHNFGNPDITTYVDREGKEHTVSTYVCSECGVTYSVDICVTYMDEGYIEYHVIQTLSLDGEEILIADRHYGEKYENPNNIVIGVPFTVYDNVIELTNNLKKNNPLFKDTYFKIIELDSTDILRYLTKEKEDINFDIVYLNGDVYRVLANDGYLNPLSEEVTQYVLDEIIETYADNAVVNGTYYGIPTESSNGFFLYYDSSVLSAEDAATLEGIVAKLQANNKTLVFDYGNAWYNSAFFYGAGAYSEWTYDIELDEYVAVDDTYNSDAGYDAYDALYNLLQSGVVISYTDYYQRDNVAAIISGIWLYDMLSSEYGDNLVATTLPTFTNGENTYQLATYSNAHYYASIPTDNADKQVLLDALLLALSGESAQINNYNRGALPTNIYAMSAVSEELTDAEKAIINQLALASHEQSYIPANWWNIAGNLGRYAESFSNAKATLEEYEKQIQDLVFVPHEHNFVIEDIRFHNGRDCTDGGDIVYRCTVCGKENYEYFYGHIEGSEPEHDYITDKDGNPLIEINYKSCPRCNNMSEFSYNILSEEIIPQDYELHYDNYNYKGRFYSADGVTGIFEGTYNDNYNICEGYMRYLTAYVNEKGIVAAQSHEEHYEKHSGEVVIIYEGIDCERGVYEKHICSDCGSEISSRYITNHNYNEDGVCVYCGSNQNGGESHRYLSRDGDEVYTEQLGEYASLLEAANNEMDDISLRYALFAEAEAELLNSAIYLPGKSQGGNYMVTRVAPHTGSFTYTGSDADRLARKVVVSYDGNKPFITAEDYQALQELWNEACASGEEYDPVAYLKAHGYQIDDHILDMYSANLFTYDILEMHLSNNIDLFIDAYEALYEYNSMGIIVPRLATGMPIISEDGLTYTIEVRSDAAWYDSDGNYYAPITADDFVAGFRHMLDANNALSYIAEDIVGVTDYLYRGGSFDNVGIRAEGNNVIITLNRPVPYFLSNMCTTIFIPMNRAYFLAHGGAFGKTEYNEARYGYNYTYATSCDTILYNSAFTIKQYGDTFQLNKNPAYYDAESILLNMIMYQRDKGEYHYDLAVNGILVGCGLSRNALNDAKKDGIFDVYAVKSGFSAVTFFGAFNINRATWDLGSLKSEQTYEEATNTRRALENANFRRALMHAWDRETYYASVGADPDTIPLINTITPYDFVHLSEDVTVNGVTFAAGTAYGDVVEYYLANKYNHEVDLTIGQDGWYNPELARHYLELAKQELGENFSTVLLDFPACEIYSSIMDYAYAFRDSIESVLGPDNVRILIETTDDDDEYYDATSRSEPQYGVYDFSDSSGWGPDYGDPSTYLDIFGPSGYMRGIAGLEGSEHEYYFTDGHAHRFVYDHATPIGGNCSNGVIVYKTCAECGYTRAERTYGHSFEYINIGLEQYGLYDYKGYGQICMYCGKVDSFDFYGQWNGGTVNSFVDENGVEHEQDISYNTETGVKYIRDKVIQPIGNCVAKVYTVYTVLYNDEIQYEYTSFSRNTEHHHYQQEIRFFDEEARCDGGYEVISTCQDCGRWESYSKYGHMIDSDTEVKVADGIHINECCICHENVIDYDWSFLEGYDCVDSEEEIDGIHHYIRTYTKEGSDISMKIDEYNEKSGCTTYRYSVIILTVGDKVYTARDIERYPNHNYVGKYKLNGESCDDGWKVNYTCSDCGESYQSNGYGHVTKTQTVDIPEVGGFIRYDVCEICGETMSFYMSGSVQKSLHWEEVEPTVDEQGVTHNYEYRHNDDFSIVYRKEYYSVPLDGCNRRIYENIEFTYGDLKITVNENYYYEQHNFETSYNFYGETCNDGYDVTYTCTKCGFSYTDEGVYGHVEKYIELYIPEADAFVYYNLCEVCGKNSNLYVTTDLLNTLIWEEVEPTVDEQGVTHNYEYRHNDDFSIVYRKEYYSVPLDGCNRRIYENIEFTYGDINLKRNSYSDYKEHTYSQEYNRFGETCEDGYTVLYTCNACGYSFESEVRYWHETERKQLEVEGYPGYFEASVCRVCGKIVDYNFMDNDLRDALTTNESNTYVEDGYVHSVFNYGIQDANFAIYIDEYFEQEFGDDCKRNYFRDVLITYDGTLSEYSDHWYDTGHTFTLDNILDYEFCGEECADGVIVTIQCAYCDHKETRYYYNHAFDENNICCFCGIEKHVPIYVYDYNYSVVYTEEFTVGSTPRISETISGYDQYEDTEEGYFNVHYDPYGLFNPKNPDVIFELGEDLPVIGPEVDSVEYTLVYRETSRTLVQ